MSQYYTADTQKNNNGDTSAIQKPEVEVFANINQFMWVTEKKFLGANFAMDLLIPVFYTDLNVNVLGNTVVDDDRFGLGDIIFDPVTLFWKSKKWDAFFATGFFIPTGKHDKPASPGTGYWTFVHQLGATYYPDQAHTWSISARSRFLHSTEDPDNDIRPGNELIIEWGIGKDIPLSPSIIFTPGIAGYSYFQLTSDSGPAGTDPSKAKGHALGPEIQLTMLKPFFLNLGLRYSHEFSVENNTEGDSFCFNVIVPF